MRRGLAVIGACFCLSGAATGRADVADRLPAAVWNVDIAARYEAELARHHGLDESFAVAVVPAADEFQLSYDPAAGRLHVRYRMDANQVAEGWSWQPEAKPEQADYYRYKFLPLGVREAQHGASYVHEDLPGRPRQVRPVWRYHYYFAFDNPYDFYARPTVEDGTGFATDMVLPPERARQLMEPGRLRLLAWAHWVPPFHAESSTFWKATDGRPVDVTMKNRYFIGHLDELWLVDGASGDLLARLRP